MVSWTAESRSTEAWRRTRAGVVRSVLVRFRMVWTDRWWLARACDGRLTGAGGDRTCDSGSMLLRTGFATAAPPPPPVVPPAAAMAGGLCGSPAAAAAAAAA